MSRVITPVKRISLITAKLKIDDYDNYCDEDISKIVLEDDLKFSRDVSLLDENDDSDTNSEGETSEDVKAPNELFMEFMDCIFQKDYPNAKKLCNMILMYEPDNTTALGFKNLIDEKIKIDEDNNEEENKLASDYSSGDEESDDDEDDDASSDSNTVTLSSADSDDSDEAEFDLNDEISDDDRQYSSSRADSGILSSQE